MFKGGAKLAWCVWVLMAWGLPAAGQQNRVLDLDGKGSYVELPSNIFTNLTEGTVEAWVKWRSTESYQRFFGFGDFLNDMGVERVDEGQPFTLQSFVNSNSDLGEIQIGGLVRLQEWCHVAAVSGPGGMRLYFNGVLVESNQYTKSFSAISGKQNFLGRWNGGQGGFDPVTFNGQIDEFRVWRSARTEEQIRENMFKRLTGQEPGLGGLWNFDDPAQPGKDASPNAFHGTPLGQAKSIPAEVNVPPSPVTTERVLDLDGNESYVELPPHLFTNQVVTVEGWMKWRAFGIYSRFFEFGDPRLQIALVNFADGGDLYFERFRAPDFDDLKAVRVPNLLSTDQWSHLSVVAGTNFSKVYVNGALVATNEVLDGWRPSPLPPRKNFLGRSVMKGNPQAASDTELNGQMGEIRLWSGERTEAQIRDNMFRRFTGREAGLLALWNFADPAQPGKDASPHGLDGCPWNGPFLGYERAPGWNRRAGRQNGAYRGGNGRDSHR